MQKYTMDEYKARALYSGVYLQTSQHEIESVRQDIDVANRRAVTHGLEPIQWIITHSVVCTYLDDNDLFVKREITETAVEVYPESI